MFQCGECSMVFTTAGSVRRHMAVHQVSQKNSHKNSEHFDLNGRGLKSKLRYFEPETNSHKNSEHFEW